MTGALWARLDTLDRILLPAIFVLGVLRLGAGVLASDVYDIGAGIGLVAYVVGRVWRAMCAPGTPTRTPLAVMAAGIGLWLAAFIGRYALS